MAESVREVGILEERRGCGVVRWRCERGSGFFRKEVNAEWCCGCNRDKYRRHSRKGGKGSGRAGGVREALGKGERSGLT